jgi:diguanylate cyclase (GGDEF)-like protein/PAS domain S-box-containing protein
MPMESPSKGQNVQLLRITWPFLVVILVLVSLAIFSIDIMSSVRAYIGGESIWSKGQKDAVFYLNLYAETGNEATYRQYLNAISGPRNLRTARLALDREKPDPETARVALIDSGVHPQDVGDVIWTFHMFRHVGYFNEAVDYWSRGDAELAQLESVGDALHALVAAGAPRPTSVVNGFKQQIRTINETIAPLSRGFSNVLSSAFRKTASLLLTVDLVAALLLVFLSTVHVRRLIHQRGRIEEALTQSEARAKATLGSIGEAVIATGPSGLIEFINPAAERIVGSTAVQCLGRPLIETFRLLHEHTRKPLDPIDDAHFGTRPDGQAADMLLQRRDGGEIFVQAVTSRISSSAADSLQMGFVLILRNMTREREYIESLAWQATHDGLTALVNRAEFERRLLIALTTRWSDLPTKVASASALLFLDLDRFKVVNDTCGHAAGDAMLREVALRFESCLLHDDTLARLGGDEFGVLLHGYDTAGIDAVAERLRACLNDFVFNWEAQPFSTSVSVGVVDLRNAEMGVEEAMRLADIACYMAKERGRDRVQVADLRDRELARHASEVSWGRRLKKALEHDHFCLYVQPIVSVGDGRLPGSTEGQRAELLLRMSDPSTTTGVIAPNLFIPAAERYGLMTAIDRWVIRHALDTLARAKEKRFCEYAINLSGASVGDERFLGFVREQFARTGVAPSLICFEITETTAIANLASAARFMSELNALGCHFALDDFGAGMSSFGYLKHLPVEYLKIDGSFVMDIVHDPVSRDMVAAINEMGHSMKCKTIAEYVESEGIMRTLCLLGVDYAQGYYIGRPAPWTEPTVFSLAREA